MSFDLKKYLKLKKEFFEKSLNIFWQDSQKDSPKKLDEAMTYSLFNSGKRIRPSLVFASAEALGLSDQDVLPIALSLELIHVFSLIHDDLPCMDDDDLRRGKPSNHKVFGEATAVLAGDALLAESILPLLKMDSKKFGYDAILKVIQFICEAVGKAGMIGGQILDLEAENQTISFEDLKRLHSKKTGALIEAAILAPAILCSAQENQLKGLQQYAKAIGLAFQIVDDLLEAEGKDLGKDQESDTKNNKSTFPRIIGLEKTKQQCDLKKEEAIQALQIFNNKAEALCAMAHYIVERKI